MKHLYSFLIVLIVVSLIACGKNSPKSGLASQNASGSNPSGTIDGGGGNSFKDKMFESYIVKPKDLSGYEILEPLLKSLRKILNEDSLDFTETGFPYYQLVNSVLEKSWYLVPTDLQTIANEKIGVPLSQGTIQVAFQTFDAVWINEKAFEKMVPEEKAKLILHEIVMGLKILKFESDAKFNQIFGVIGYKAEDEAIVHPERLTLKITAEDVSQVRTVTRKFWELLNFVDQKSNFKNGFNKKDFAAIMEEFNFERILYRSKTNGNSYGLYQLGAGHMVKNIASIFEGINNRHQFLVEDFSKASCELSVKKITDSQAEVELKIEGKKYSKFKVNLPKKIYYTFGQRIINDSQNPKIDLIGPGSYPDSRKILTLYFESNELEGLEVQELAIENFKNSDGHPVASGTAFGEQILCNKLGTQSTDD
ncbi:MAG: hypothetical protein V4596_10590 [Bdellovibrionota bacterium]